MLLDSRTGDGFTVTEPTVPEVRSRRLLADAAMAGRIPDFPNVPAGALTDTGLTGLDAASWTSHISDIQDKAVLPYSVLGSTVVVRVACKLSSRTGVQAVSLLAGDARRVHDVAMNKTDLTHIGASSTGQHIALPLLFSMQVSCSGSAGICRCHASLCRLRYTSRCCAGWLRSFVRGRQYGYIMTIWMSLVSNNKLYVRLTAPHLHCTHSIGLPEADVDSNFAFLTIALRLPLDATTATGNCILSIDDDGQVQDQGAYYNLVCLALVHAHMPI